MPRRFASQVHEQASRLLRVRYLKKEPAWFQAVMQHPPLPLPPKLPPSRTAYDTATHATKGGKLRARDPRPLPIAYLEDDIRRQFFRDHPFEAFRAVSLVEKDKIEAEHPVRGLAWTRLRQRGRNPRPEDAIRFAVSLHEHHNVPVSRAYTMAVEQFRALRSEHHIATTMAVVEAEEFGAQFGPTVNERMFAEEMKAVDSWQSTKESNEAAMVSSKKWKAIIDKTADHEAQWTKGQEYVRLWKEGVRPSYAPALTEPIMNMVGGLNPESAQEQMAAAPTLKDFAIQRT